MKKQLALLITTFIAFIGIWVLVIMQMTNHQLDYSQESPMHGSEFEEITLDKADNKENETAFKDEEGSTNKEDDEIVITVSDNEGSYLANETIDLSNYDFSDISARDGVPIDGILEKIGIAE
ncbi:hypothetical protein [Halalkalibacter hemicellulosilyticus]|uniref:Uncharacterized protein n=1 Tax=Halalkalibacter hemicellulosilyticusJCM 9152 TaxID=1236971 RepID=W4QCI8_9BACI|nr:hypothetical protein [Halalkalibacter hemicellulosilyticus]GAE29089.1 hypothetical protein JCM9152_429 [Halalkalibacter hemicellulosilyticusJCM 9152]